MNTSAIKRLEESAESTGKYRHNNCIKNKNKDKLRRIENYNMLKSQVQRLKKLKVRYPGRHHSELYGHSELFQDQPQKQEEYEGENLLHKPVNNIRFGKKCVILQGKLEKFKKTNKMDKELNVYEEELINASVVFWEKEYYLHIVEYTGYGW